MKKFLNKLENKLDSNSSSSSSSRTTTTTTQSGGRYAPPPPQQQQQQQQQQYYGQQQSQQQNFGYSQPPGPPPPSNTAGVYSQPSGPPPGGAGSQGQGQGAHAAAGVEDPFAALRRYDTVFIVDDSESMEMFWDETREALVGVVQKAVIYDSDGIDLYFFNSQVVVEGLKTAQDVRSLFNRVDPRRSTPTAKALRRVTDPYMAKLEAAHAAKQQGRNDVQPVKPLNIVVLTDGAPDRNESPEGVIVDIGKRLDNIRAPPFQIGFSFVQIGVDEEAQEALTYLDDHLKTEYGIRDMVDTTLSPPGGQIDSQYLLKALLGGVNRKVDKQN